MKGSELTERKNAPGLLRLVIAALLLYAAVRYCAAGKILKEAESARRALGSDVAVLREEQRALLDALESEPDDREIEKLARERLGLVMPNETIFYFTEKDGTKDKEG